MAAQNKFYKYKVTQIDIKNNVITWENHTLPLSGISRIWADVLPKIPFPSGAAFILLFIALSGRSIESTLIMISVLAVGAAAWLLCHRSDNTERWINIELYSGEIYSLSTGSNDFIDQFYEALKESFGSSTLPGREINFNTDGKIVSAVKDVPAIEEPVNESPGIMGISGQGTKNSQLVSELQKLYQCYIKKTDADSEILNLINDAARLIDSNDQEGLKTSFKKFVLAGLINDCNDLGLDSLITEIRNSVY
ncbi:DUF6232 family protein [Clostridium transplantifaecale]|uniref:DUF6232 family protein n=1 Tax=Clostridium transplantifaecale TaxID=2479838 RepID=UPI000F63B0EC|nr:DUF6232 family protein [Clostridium transplantifaecale]